MRAFRRLFLAGLVAATAQPLAAQTLEDYDYENLEFRGIGVDLGWVTPSRVDNTLMLGLRVDLGFLGPNIRILPGITYWSSDMRAGEVQSITEEIQAVCLREFEALRCPQLSLGRVRMSDLAFNMDAHYEWTDAPLLVIPYAGLGGGIHLLNARGTAINGTFIEDYLDAISPALNLIGGIRIPFAEAVELTSEARYVLSSEIRHATFSVGAVWLFPNRSRPPGAMRQPVR